MIKKVDILNFITDSRKAPNDVKTHTQLVNHLGSQNEATISTMLAELMALKVVRLTEKNGEKAYQVIAR
jgi:arginine repressor